MEPTTPKPNFSVIEDLIDARKVRDIIPQKQTVITIPSDSTISEAIKILSENRILSAPVEAVCGEQRTVSVKYLGFIDMFDILKYILSIYGENRQTEIGTLHGWCQSIGTLIHKGKLFAHHSISDLVGASKIDPYCTVTLDYPLSSLVAIFRNGLHRAAVVSDNNSLQYIATQSDVLQFLARNTQHFGVIAQTTIADINLGTHQKILTMNAEARAINCFHQMMTSGVSACGIVDKSGVLTANLSVSDLKGLSQENFASLLLPALDFIQRTNATIGTTKSTAATIPTTPLAPVSVSSSTSFDTVIQMLGFTRLHRLWVVDDYGRPCGLITLTDIMKLLDLRVTLKNQVED